MTNTDYRQPFSERELAVRCAAAGHPRWSGDVCWCGDPDLTVATDGEPTDTHQAEVRL